MCGRYHLSTPPEALAKIFGFIDLPNLAAHWNIAPTQSAPIIHAEKSGARRMEMARWGLVPPWAKTPNAKGQYDGPPLINARGETIAEKQVFRNSFRHSRVLAPADGFYEWTGKGKDKRAFCIRPTTQHAFAFAGITAAMPSGFAGPPRSFSIITTDANAALMPIHHRMPVVIPVDLAPVWLNGTPAEAAELISAAPETFFEFYEVDTRVGNVTEDDSRLLRALPDRQIEESAEPDPAKPNQLSLF